ncbi:PAS domain S-box-containing protein [Angulomicrobium tetraedrale]|uniref:histidine kinase n=1 Tax=Ancylobacter tetraedralis TaxID=217068 RepID=A0A839ZB43_9HYPH|nr:PAS domain-containing sensor histidine kinase [Ancylobacter tetraedralis]MBB3771949.1 PAS domain S-box-containing protein [Ancylobacter tetraedralis]
MTGDRGRGVTIALTFLAVLACAALLTFAVQRLLQVEKEMSGGFGESLMWALTQAQYENQALVIAVQDWNAGARSAADADKLRLLADLAYSRLQLLADGPFSRDLAAKIGGDVITGPRARLATLDERLQAALADQAPIVAQAVEPVLRDVADLRAASNKILLTERYNLAAQRDAYRRALLEVTVAVAITIACGAFIVARLWAHARAAARAEAAMRRERDFSRLLLESSGDGIVAFDRDMRCTHWNAAMGSLLPGADGATLVGRNLPEVLNLPPEHVGMGLMRDTLAGRTSFLAARQLPGGDRYIEMTGYPVKAEEAIIGGIAFVRDVTEAHLAKLEVLEHRDRLEALVHSRTKDLEDALTRETGLRELYKGFVAMVSHQFRTPLSIVDSGAQRMIRRGAEMSGEEIRERAGKIRAAALRLTRLVTNTLNAAKLDAGQIDVSMRRCDLAKLVQEACERQRETASDRHFELSLEALPESVMCDPLLMDQIVSNLLSNAVKYSTRPDPIEVRAVVEDEWIRLAVCDRGVGIPPDERDQLFERFFRATTSAGIEGTGIGLHVARTIARMHGGDVDAAPREGGGSTFTLSIPREAMAA